MTQGYDASTIEAAAKVATSFLVGDPKNGIPLRSPMPHEIADAIRALPVSPAPAIGSETVEKLREALAALEASASQVARYGAQTGPQWPTLTTALIKARAALATTPPMKED